MASRDPAFLWETEVLRSSQHRHDSERRQRDAPGDWRTIREASEATGVPTSTIRKWARNHNIPSFMEQTGSGQVRRVSMSGISQWAGHLGRDLDPNAESVESPAEPEDRTLDATAPVAPEGTMLVPLDAWNRMLKQLGNLHEAGQQLAEARERAAKAETEARFLKERLTELREELETAKGPARRRASDPSDGRAAENRLTPTSLARSIYQSWRAGRRSS